MFRFNSNEMKDKQMLVYIVAYLVGVGVRFEFF